MLCFWLCSYDWISISPASSARTDPLGLPDKQGLKLAIRGLFDNVVSTSEDERRLVNSKGNVEDVNILCLKPFACSD